MSRMHSFLIISKNKSSREEEANKICKNFNIDDFDINILEKTADESIGIEDIRNFQQKLSLKPFKSRFKSGIIKNADKLTIEAQNALLKTLEEPPQNTILILLSDRKELFLPTVLSRCKIIEIKEKISKIPEKDSTENLNILISLFSCGVGEKLKIAQDHGKTKEEAANFLENMILTSRQMLIKNINTSPEDKTLNLKNILLSLQKTYTIMKTTNVNPRLALEKLFLDLPEN